MVRPWSPKPKMWVRFLLNVPKRGEALMAEARGSYPREAGSSPDALTNFAIGVPREGSYTKITDSVRSRPLLVK